MSLLQLVWHTSGQSQAWKPSSQRGHQQVQLLQMQDWLSVRAWQTSGLQLPGQMSLQQCLHQQKHMKISHRCADLPKSLSNHIRSVHHLCIPNLTHIERWAHTAIKLNFGAKA